MPVTDVIYLTKNRLEFTKLTLEKLLENTNWDLVRHLIVYDDSSIDGTHSYVVKRLSDVLQATTLTVNYGSPVAIMNRYVETFGQDSNFFAKVDNDIVMPPGWLDWMLTVLERHPELEVLGAQYGMAPPTVVSKHTYTPSSHIGGIGVIRTEALRSRPPIVPNGRFGWTEWQAQYEPVRGWITPDLRVCQLDLVPWEPWKSLAAMYVEKGWQRYWPPYGESDVPL